MCIYIYIYIFIYLYYIYVYMHISGMAKSSGSDFALLMSGPLRDRLGRCWGADLKEIGT